MNYSPGIYENLPYEEYAAIPAYRSHDLTSVIKCPYTWKYQKDLEPSPALLEGRVQHTYDALKILCVALGLPKELATVANPFDTSKCKDT